MPTFKYRELLSRLGRHGVVEYQAQGKGSERVWILETVKGSRKGPQITVKCHGEGKDIRQGTQKAILRRFNLKLKDILD